MSKQAITDQQRNARINSPTTGSATRLAEIEKSALAFQATVFEEKRSMQESGNYTDSYIGQQVAMAGHAWIAERTKLEEILGNIEASISTAPVTIPKRTDEHREISSHFKTLKGDKRQEAIVRAITGRDQKLAEALANEPASTSSLMDFDRNAIIKNLQPDGFERDQARITDLRSRAQATRATLSEVTNAIVGASTS